MKCVLFFMCIFLRFTAAQAELIPLKAVYEFPVSEAVLRKYARFAITDYTVEVSSPGEAIMTMRLPSELVGPKAMYVEMNLVKTDKDKKFLAGPLGDAVCVGPWKDMTCEYEFKNLKIDRAALNKYLTAKYGNNISTLNRRVVARRFETEPIGVGFVIAIRN